MSPADSSIISQVRGALSVTSLRQRVIASNIAHRDTQGYQRLQLQFDRAMAGTNAVVVAESTPKTPVSLEQDLVASSSNAAHYGTLARVLSRYLAIAGDITAGRG
jgi:flagellar basal-body rod protein FlgB